ncbi:hypothetical protein P7K49_040090 [Saguinus oedipus]|uniref:Uncharacterized protein n=1 Tax=Saguinus oedipus TaxID=9490 RepID=A0ABQ9TC56_SAGOE|nr:hypothetical protein P7K49_040090 [Saguinus oedipus]
MRIPQQDPSICKAGAVHVRPTWTHVKAIWKHTEKGSSGCTAEPGAPLAVHGLPELGLQDWDMQEPETLAPGTTCPKPSSGRSREVCVVTHRHPTRPREPGTAWRT